MAVSLSQHLREATIDVINAFNSLISRFASDSDSGLVKTNSAENIALNADGQLTVGGRLGQTEQGGLYYPLTSVPALESRDSLLLSEAVGLTLSNRSIVTGGGSNITLKVAAAAGATEYQVSNTQANRFLIAPLTGGRLALDFASAGSKTVEITSIKFANGNPVTPYFGATEANNNIIITVAETLNPDSTITSVRGYGIWESSDTLSVGQGNGSTTGKTLLIGQCLYSNAGGQNQIAMVGNRMYTTQGSCIVVGSENINTSRFGAVFGEGHDTTGAGAGVAVFGRYSSIDSNTLMAVGNGTRYDKRSNAFEVLKDGIVLKSPNNTRYKISVDNNGNLTATAM